MCRFGVVDNFSAQKGYNNHNPKESCVSWGLSVDKFTLLFAVLLSLCGTYAG
jgi:hypothetical protein